MHDTKHCTNCGQPLCAEEIKKDECWNCIAMQSDMIEFDQQDEYLLPNALIRQSPVDGD